MIALRVSLFQTLRVVSSEGRPLDMGSPTTRSLFAYLILNRAHPTDRRHLAFLFWPRGTESAARRNLRQYLHRLRRSLEPVNPQGNFIRADGNSVQIDPQLQAWMDVDVFRHGVRPQASLAELQMAVSLYAGDLLEDVYDDWCQEERQSLRHSYLQALRRLSCDLSQRGELGPAVTYAQKWVNAEPFDEQAQRQLIELYALSGDRNRALRHYRIFQKSLREELQTDPLPETQTLYENLLKGGVEAVESTSTPGGEGAEIAAEAYGFTLKGEPEVARHIPLIGREGELQQLKKASLDAASGLGHFMLVTGESGIGKTRLLHEFLEDNPDLLALHVVCHELEALLPYASIRPILKQGLQKLALSPGAQPPGWITPILQLAPEQGLGVDPARDPGGNPPEFERVAESFQMLIGKLIAQCSPQPLYLIMDDLHWSDTPSCHLLAQLAQYADGKRLLILGMCRLEDLAPERLSVLHTLERNQLLTQISLHRLTYDETTALASYLLPDQGLEKIFTTRLYQETEGNPFFTIEILRSVRESGSLSGLPSDRSRAVALPMSIQRAIQARLDRLSETSRELLASAAAFGRAFTFSMLKEISRIDDREIVGYIEEWVHRGLIRENGGGYDFGHDKIRQVAYGSLSHARRQYVHRQIAEVLANAIPPAESASLAYHFTRSDQPLRALPYLTRAGEQALQVRSYHEARQFGLQAISLLGRLPGPRQRSERIDLSIQLAQAYAFSGDLDRAQEILNETEPLAIGLGDGTRLGQLFYRSAQLYWLRGQPELAGNYARRTLRSAEDLKDIRLRRAALRMLGRVSIALSAFDDAIAYLVSYMDTRDQAPTPTDLPIVLGYLGVAYSRVGSWERALQVARQGVDMAGDLVGKQGVDSGRLEAAPRGNASQALMFASMQLGFIYADHRKWQSCLEILRPFPDSVEDISRGRGDKPFSEAASDKIQADGADREDRLTPLEFMLLGLKGRTLAHLGEPRAGIETIQPVLEWAERTDYRVFHYLPRIFLAESMMLAGELALAETQVGLALQQAREAGNRWAVGVALHLSAEISMHEPLPDWAAIEAELIEAMHLLRQARARPDLARTYLALRRVYDRAGQIAWAVDCHFRATTIFEELGMLAELRQAQGRASLDRRRSVVIPGLTLRGPNVGENQDRR
jgi:DNA-binding SARP family transcriptional activator